MEITAVYIFCLVSVGLTTPVKFQRTSSLLNYESCIEVDLVQIEELKHELFNRLPSLDSIEADKGYKAFGLLPADWDRLNELERSLPRDSLMKSRLVMAFRLLIAALYQAHLKPTGEKYEDQSSTSSKGILKGRFTESGVEPTPTNRTKSKVNVEFGISINKSVTYPNPSVGVIPETISPDDVDNEVAGSNNEETAIPYPSFDKNYTTVTTSTSTATESIENSSHIDNLNSNKSLENIKENIKNGSTTFESFTSSPPEVAKGEVPKLGNTNIIKNTNGTNVLDNLIKTDEESLETEINNQNASRSKEYIITTDPNRYFDSENITISPLEIISHANSHPKPSTTSLYNTLSTKSDSSSKGLTDDDRNSFGYLSTTKNINDSSDNTQYDADKKLSYNDSTTKNKTISTTTHTQGNIRGFTLPAQITDNRKQNKDLENILSKATDLLGVTPTTSSQLSSFIYTTHEDKRTQIKDEYRQTKENRDLLNKPLPQKVTQSSETTSSLGTDSERNSDDEENSNSKTNSTTIIHYVISTTSPNKFEQNDNSTIKIIYKITTPVFNVKKVSEPNLPYNSSLENKYKLFTSSKNIIKETSTAFTQSETVPKMNSYITNQSNFLQPTQKYNELQSTATNKNTFKLSTKKLENEEESEVTTPMYKTTTNKKTNTPMTTKLSTTSLPEYFDNSLYDDGGEHGGKHRIFDIVTNSPKLKTPFDVSKSQQTSSTIVKTSPTTESYFTIFFRQYVENTQLSVPVPKLNIFQKEQYPKPREEFRNDCSGNNQCVRVKNIQYQYFDLPNNGRKFVPHPSFPMIYNMQSPKFPEELNRNGEYYKWWCKLYTLGKNP